MDFELENPRSKNERDEEPTEAQEEEQEPIETQEGYRPEETLPPPQGSNETQPSTEETHKIDESEAGSVSNPKAKKSVEVSESQCENENFQMETHSVVEPHSQSAASKTQKNRRKNIERERSKKIKKEPKKEKGINHDAKGKVLTKLLSWMKRNYPSNFLETPAVHVGNKASKLYYIWMNLIGAPDMLLKVPIIHEMIQENPKLQNELGPLEMKRVNLYITFYNIVRKLPNLSNYYDVPAENNYFDDLQLFRGKFKKIQEYDNFYQKLFKIMRRLKQNPSEFSFSKCFEELKNFMLDRDYSGEKTPFFGFSKEIIERRQETEDLNYIPQESIAELDSIEGERFLEEIEDLFKIAVKDNFVVDFMIFDEPPFHDNKETTISKTISRL